MKKLKNSGFSVIEMIIYLGLLSGLLVILTDMFLSSLNIKQESEATSSLEQDGRYILSRLAYDIHRAQSITVPASLGTTSKNTLTLVINGSQFIYTSSFRNLWLQDNLDTQRLNGNRADVTDFSITRFGNNPVAYPNIKNPKDTLKIDLTLEATASSGLESRTFETAVGLR